MGSSARACWISSPAPGALGLEALSRGAASAVFVEENAGAVKAIEQNFVRTKLRGRVRRMEVFAFLEAAGSRERYDHHLRRSAV
jgi:16S rRNA G966 N2-methylase RsmD